VKYYGWKKVTILGHSLGGSIGFLYAAAFPEDTEKLICIDIASPAVRPATYFVQHTGRAVDQFLFYENMNEANVPSYTHDDMMKLMLEAYKGALTKESSEIMLKRGALPVTSSDCDMKGGGFCFSRDTRLKIGSLGFLSMDMALEYASKITCEVLNIKGKPGMQFDPPESYHIVLDKIRNSAKKLEFHEVEGTHFLHLNNPESICPIIVKFLKS
jgi:pimeloyl-ACP methyl ester carboxylesterase